MCVELRDSASMIALQLKDRWCTCLLQGLSDLSSYSHSTDAVIAAGRAMHPDGEPLNALDAYKAGIQTIDKRDALNCFAYSSAVNTVQLCQSTGFWMAKPDCPAVQEFLLKVRCPLC